MCLIFLHAGKSGGTAVRAASQCGPAWLCPAGSPGVGWVPPLFSEETEFCFHSKGVTVMCLGWRKGRGADICCDGQLLPGALVMAGRIILNQQCSGTAYSASPHQHRPLLGARMSKEHSDIPGNRRLWEKRIYQPPSHELSLHRWKEWWVAWGGVEVEEGGGDNSIVNNHSCLFCLQEGWDLCTWVWDVQVWGRSWASQNCRGDSWILPLRINMGQAIL